MDIERKEVIRREEIAVEGRNGKGEGEDEED